MADEQDPFSSSFNDEFKIDEELFIDLSQVSVGHMISEGPYSIVYEGSYKNMPVAVKVIQPDSSSNVSPERKVKFKREVVLLSKMRHENIVKFIGAAVEPALIIITELMKGGTLQRFLWSMRPHRLDLKQSLSFALGISQAMEYLHSNGVLHRDLKPSNLLLTQDKKVVKLADFGLAREETANEMTAEAGTYRWMAPEMFDKDEYISGKKMYDRKVDVYSYSLVLWELLTNTTPFKGRNSVMVAYAAAVNMRPSMDDIPKELKPLVESCWAVDPTTRPEFKEISAFLSNFLGSMSSKKSTTSISSRKSTTSISSRKSTSTEALASKRTEDEVLVDPEEISNTKSGKSCFKFLGCFSDPH